MNKQYKLKILKLFIIFLIVCLPNFNYAKELLIFADSISYDEEENIIAKGNAKIFQNDELIISELIIYNKSEEIFIIPGEFTFRDNNKNYFEGENGTFIKNLNFAEFDNPKVKLNDGSRITGKKLKRDGGIDIVSKGVYTPCKSRIKIGNFICPTWQLEGEKILHDNENLFLYQKHSKMRVLNTPVFYVPYIVTPSPLRKERKSGFLSPSISLNFFDTQTSQSTSFPYYFNLSVDKELTFTPILNYGAGVDSSQRFMFDYNQILSGGVLSTNLIFDSNFENENNNKWLKDASLITNYNQNINNKFKLSLDSALQTSQNYIQKTQPNNDLSYSTSLSTKLKLQGYYLNKKDDYFETFISTYQTNQKNEDNKTTPIVLPSLSYYTGTEEINEYNISGIYKSYNIYRDKNTSIHAKNQQKFAHTLNLHKDIYKLNSKFMLKSELHNQIFNTEKILINTNKYHTGTTYRFFPILSMDIETPFKFKEDKYNFTLKPITQIVLTPGKSNTNKISNEDSSINSFTLNNFSSLNRYSGTDKIDNSKRINYGINISNEKINFNLSQTYEFTDNSNFHYEQGNDDHLSDLLGSLKYDGNNKISYNFRYDSNDKFMKQQNIIFNKENDIANFNISYLDKKSKTDELITQDTETINYNVLSKKFLNFSSIRINGLYDLQKEINTEYSLGYEYFDECFGINLDFNRKSYKEDDLEPQDILTLMFSFKNIGSYKSTNLAVSETDKQDIRWDSLKLDNEIFYND